MKLAVLLICGYLAVSTSAAGGFALESSASAEAEEDIEDIEIDVKSTTAASTTKAVETKASYTDVVSESKTKVVKSPPKPSWHKLKSTPKPSMLDKLPFPMDVFMKTFGKGALKALDVESMCDAVQLIDWKNYQAMLENEDFAGFKEQITHDQILIATAEAFQEATTSYMNKILSNLSKTIKTNGYDVLQNNFQELLSSVTIDVAQKESKADLKKNIQNFVGNIKIDKTAQKQALENLQKNLNNLIEVLATAKAQNSVRVSEKSNISV